MNQVVNFFWTILCFIPVIAYWMGAGSLLPCYSFLGVGVVSLLLPARLLQLSDDTKFYEGIGVKYIRKFVQNGDLVNRFIRNNNPGYRLIKSKANAVQYLKTVTMYERYHFLCFVFFVLTVAHSLISAQYVFTLLILLANIIYNVCPILLQQYNRARLKRLSK